MLQNTERSESQWGSHNPKSSRSKKPIGPIFKLKKLVSKNLMFTPEFSNMEQENIEFQQLRVEERENLRKLDKLDYENFQRGKISRRMLKKHSSKFDAWIGLFGKVYDLTGFLNNHPGGSRILKKKLGEDATKDFEKHHKWLNPEMLLKDKMVGDLID